jgi:hypothetical protein
MKVIHLSKDEICEMVVIWAKEYKKNNPNKKTWEDPTLKRYIGLVEGSFGGLTWREEYLNFVQGL